MFVIGNQRFVDGVSQNNFRQEFTLGVSVADVSPKQCSHLQSDVSVVEVLKSFRVVKTKFEGLVMPLAHLQVFKKHVSVFRLALVRYVFRFDYGIKVYIKFFVSVQSLMLFMSPL